MGAESVAKQYAENKFRNQAIQGQNEALLKQFITDPEMEKFAPEGATKLIEKAQQGGGLSLSDNIKLNGYLNTTLSTRKAIQDQQMEAQKKALLQQQVQMNQMEMAKAQRAQQVEMAKQARLEQLGKDEELVNRGPVAGFGTGVMDAQMRNPAVQRVEQASANPYLKLASQAQAAGVPIGAAMEYDIATRKVGGPQKPSLENVRDQDAKGRPIQVTIDTSIPDKSNPYGFKIVSKGPMSEGQRPVLSPEEEADKIERVGRTDYALKVNNSILDTGVTASDTIRDVDRAMRLLDDPAVYTGTAGDFVTAAKRAGSVFGAPIEGVAKAEELQNLLGDRVLQRINQTKGAVSDTEMKLFETWSSSMAKTKEGNKAILTALKTKAERDRKAASVIREMRKAGKKEAEINDAVDKLVSEMPLFTAEVEQMLTPTTGTTKKSKPAEASAAKKTSAAQSILEEYGVN